MSTEKTRPPALRVHAIVICFFVTACIGCETPGPKPLWKVTIESPTGDVVKVEHYRSHREPRQDYDREIMLDGRTRRYVPHGWYLSAERVAENR